MNNGNKKVGILSGVLGTLAVIAGVIVYILISSLFNRLFVGAHLGSDASCALLGLSMAGITVSFILYELIFIAWIFKRSKAGGRINDDKLKKLFVLVLIACICLSLIFAIVSSNTFTRCDSDSISKVCFVTTREYRWDTRCDILRYSLTCSPEGSLEFKITMKDGEVIELWSAVNSCTDEFIGEFENLYGYAAYLDDQFSKSGFIIESRIDGVEYMEKYYKDAYPEIWKHLETIIENNTDIN